MAKRDKEEKDLLESYDRGERKSVRGKECLLKQYVKGARDTMRNLRDVA